MHQLSLSIFDLIGWKIASVFIELSECSGMLMNKMSGRLDLLLSISALTKFIKVFHLRLYAFKFLFARFHPTTILKTNNTLWRDTSVFELNIKRKLADIYMVVRCSMSIEALEILMLHSVQPFKCSLRTFLFHLDFFTEAFNF